MPRSKSRCRRSRPWKLRFTPRRISNNVQSVVDTQHHLIVAHEVTNIGNDRGQLSGMARQAKGALGVEALDVLAGRGYFKGEETSFLIS